MAATRRTWTDYPTPDPGCDPRTATRCCLEAAGTPDADRSPLARAVDRSAGAVAQTPRASPRPVSRRVICLGRPSEAVRTPYTKSRFGFEAVGRLCATA